MFRTHFFSNKFLVQLFLINSLGGQRRNVSDNKIGDILIVSSKLSGALKKVEKLVIICNLFFFLEFLQLVMHLPSVTCALKGQPYHLM